MDLNESQTRALLINPLLVNAEWKLSDRTQVGFEIPVAGYDPQPWNGITDYCLYRPSGSVLGIVEAKPTINLKELKEFKIPVPPLPLQEQFALLVARHERLRAVQRESLRQSEHLFQSLLHHAFNIPH